MADLLTSVPAQPGMLPRGAPVLTPCEGAWIPSVVVHVHSDGSCSVAGRYGGVMFDDDEVQPADLHLDLTEPLGRAIGWAWVYERWDAERDDASIIGLDDAQTGALLRAARDWRPMTAADVDRFARLILAVGREA